jgi:hypothetical protein
LTAVAYSGAINEKHNTMLMALNRRLEILQGIIDRVSP